MALQELVEWEKISVLRMTTARLRNGAPRAMSRGDPHRKMLPSAQPEAESAAEDGSLDPAHRHQIDLSGYQGLDASLTSPSRGGGPGY